MQQKEVRQWCQDKYGKEWWNVDPVIKKARLDEAKKALDKPYAKKPSMRAGNGAKLCANKGIEQMKPVYFMRNNDAEDEDDREEWIAKIPPLVAVTDEIGKYVFDKTNNVKKEGNKYTTWWSVWIYWDDYEDVMLGTTPFISNASGDKCCYDNVDGLSATDVLLLLCEDGKWEDGFGPYVERGGFNDGWSFDVDNANVIVDEAIWSKVSQETRARFLRECFAERVFILEAVG